MSDSRRKCAVNTRGRPFEKGNPGKPLGARNRVTRAVEALLGDEHEALTRKVLEKALEGDLLALRLCMERLVPARKDLPVQFDYKPVRTAADAVNVSQSILSAVAGGDLTPDEAGRVMALLVAHKGMIETGALEARISALEDRT